MNGKEIAIGVGGATGVAYASKVLLGFTPIGAVGAGALFLTALAWRKIVQK